MVDPEVDRGAELAQSAHLGEEAGALSGALSGAELASAEGQKGATRVEVSGPGSQSGAPPAVDSGSKPGAPSLAPVTSSVVSRQEPSVVQCGLGAMVAGALAWGLYLLTRNIAVGFATHPVATTNMLTLKVAIAVRTLIVGMASLGTFVFGFVGLGLLALGVQLGLQRSLNRGRN